MQNQGSNKIEPNEIPDFNEIKINQNLYQLIKMSYITSSIAKVPIKNTYDSTLLSAKYCFAFIQQSQIINIA
jgi:hypothetical protein